MLSKYLIILILLVSNNLWANASVETSKKAFCTELVANNLKKQNTDSPESKRLSFGKQFNLIFNILFTPKNIVEMNTLELSEDFTEEGIISKQDMDESSHSVNGKKYAFLFIKEAFISQEENRKLKSLKKSLRKRQSQINDLDFTRELKNITDQSRCQTLVEQYSEDYNRVIQLSQDIDRARPLLKEQQDALFYKLTMLKTKFLKRKGWTIIKSATFYKANQLMNQDGVAALFITHSTHSGKIIDANGNTTPKQFFKSIPNSVDKVIMYSCHSNAVIKHYAINSKKRSYVYSYPLVKNQFQLLFKNSIPLISLKKIRKTLKLKPKKLSSQDKCHVTLNSNHSNDGYNLYLNRHYIGSLNTQKSNHTFAFDCELSKEINYVTIYRTKDSKIDTSGDHFISVTIDRSLTTDLSNHYSKTTNNHIVSKTKLTTQKE